MQLFQKDYDAVKIVSVIMSITAICLFVAQAYYTANPALAKATPIVSLF
jgi:hypothetical protein